MTPEPDEGLVFVQARRRLDEPRSADRSALEWMGLVLRVGAAWIGCGARLRVAGTAAALAARLGRRVALDSTGSPSLSLRPAYGCRGPSPLRGVGAARWSWHDLLAYGDRLGL